MSFTNSPKTPSWVALVDCNNFFVSCERIFDPSLRKKPVVVLSSNDGCIVSRSNEAKALGIPMGAPHFQWADFMKSNDVIVRSSNFTLYGDISHRVMSTLSHFHPDLEIYSIDEAFLLFHGEKEPLSFLHDLRKKIGQWVGIPVSIGVSSTKTLAKVAGHVAKKVPLHGGVFGLFTASEIDKALSHFAAIDIWGIGRRMSTALAKKGVRTALDFKNQGDEWIKRNFSVHALRTAWELRGVSCFTEEEEPVPKQSIMTSRSFGSPVQTIEELEKALSHFATRGGEKLREEGSLASCLDVFIMTSSHKEDFYSNSAHVVFPESTDYTPSLIEGAKKGLKAIFKPDLLYKKGGILLSGLVRGSAYQQDLFVPQETGLREKREKAMRLVDQVNGKFGNDALQFAVTYSKTASWRSQSTLISRGYTTKWEDLLSINIM